MVGYYGTVNSDKIHSEDDKPGTDFLAEVCRLWEKKADLFSHAGIRTVKIRIGLVLTSNGGALAKMITPIKWGIGSALGSGKQFMPWIHLMTFAGFLSMQLWIPQLRAAIMQMLPNIKTIRHLLKHWQGF